LEYWWFPSFALYVNENIRTVVTVVLLDSYRVGLVSFNIFREWIVWVGEKIALE
jgi:hypothetical protein